MESIVIKKLREALEKGQSHEVYFDIFKGGHDYLCWGEGLFKGLKSVMKK